MTKTLRQHILIRQSLATGSAFGSNINLNFTPTEVIIRELGYIPNNLEKGLLVVYSDLVYNQPLGMLSYNRLDASSVFDSPVVCSQSELTLTNFTNNSIYNFKVLDGETGALLNGSGYILMHLEFICNK